jgi:hypothetical protein
LRTRVSGALIEQAFFSSDICSKATVEEMLLCARGGSHHLYLASDDDGQDELVALWRAIRRQDTNTPFVLLLNNPLTSENVVLRYGFDAAVEVMDGAIALRMASDQWLQASEHRAMQARDAEVAAINDELRERLAWLEARVEISRQAIARAEERVLRAVAMRAFLAQGGTQRSFEPLWPDVLNEAIDRSYSGSSSE